MANEESKNINYKINDILGLKCPGIFGKIKTGKEIHDLLETYKTAERQKNNSKGKLDSAEKKIRDEIEKLNDTELKNKIIAQFNCYKEQTSKYKNSYAPDMPLEDPIEETEMMENDMKSWLMKRAASDRRARVDFLKELAGFTSQCEGSIGDVVDKFLTIYKKQRFKKKISSLTTSPFATPEKALQLAVGMRLDEYYKKIEKINKLKLENDENRKMRLIHDKLDKDIRFERLSCGYQTIKFFINFLVGGYRIYHGREVFLTEREADFYGKSDKMLIKSAFYAWIKDGEKIRTVGRPEELKKTSA